MGFNKVYGSLVDIFPQVDQRILKAVAIENSKDADKAVEVVLTEILPALPVKTVAFDSPLNRRSAVIQLNHEVKNVEKSNMLRGKQVSSGSDAPSSSKQTTKFCENLMDTSPTCDAFNVDTVLAPHTFTVSTIGEMALNQNGTFGGIENDKLILLGNSPKSGCESVANGISNFNLNELDQLVHEDSKFFEQFQAHTNYEIKVPGVPERIKNTSLKIVSDNSLPLQGNVGVNDSSNHDSKDSQQPADLRGRSPANGIMVEIGDVAAQLSYTAELAPDSSEFSLHSESISTDPAKQGGNESEFIEQVASSEMENMENESTLSVDATHSNQISRIDLLEEIIEDARNNKKTLLLAMQSVLNMITEVELQEKAPEKAKEEAGRAGLDTLSKVEEIIRLLTRAKEANDMHAGEIYGEKAILATEARELQSRLISISEQRDRSLAILDEMHQTLEERRVAAEEARRAAEREVLEKEESARKVLAEQEAKMEKVVQELKLIQQEAEENAKLREFLMDRGQIVDSLQGEIFVICEDVRLLKEKFDKGIPLSKSISPSQTSCILASSGSSSISAASDFVAEQQSENPKIRQRSPTPSLSGDSTKSKLAEDGFSTERKDLIENGWDLFESDEAEML